MIRELDRTVPERCPTPDQTDREIWLYAGKRALVRGLLARLERAEKKDL